MAIKRVHAYVSGRVQGVFFRETTRRKGEELNLSGWVRNLPDGRVETVAQGEEEMVKEFLEWLYTGSSYSRVENVDFEWEAGVEPLAGFSVRR